ncbi:uncharacterized protein LOC122304711 [Carya illinoinensis]|uniref:uncharacterized protein LOC122304711 n=1 Tax=Carya illinoinensis TaxID=32201 RepID=UPI001C71BB40|nr:uncharacterized protein LOC122304711 [Carya illinoinensis]
MFKRSVVETLAARRSDHRPILLTSYRTGFSTMVKSHRFMFEAKWTKDVEGEDVVRKEWRRVTCEQDGWGKIKEKFKACAQVLTKWNKGKKVDCAKEILEKKKGLRKLQDVEGPLNIDAVKNLQKELEILFFHLCATQRHKKNQIRAIHNMQGRKWESHSEISEAFTQYFKDIFSSIRPTNEDLSCCLNCITKRVTEDMNYRLQKPFIREEHIVGDEVSESVLHFLNGGRMDRGINSTVIALIPKVKDPSIVNQFRLISLCNVVYKLVSKVLVNKLKHVLDLIVSSNQSVFIPNRLITDNVITAYELLHSMKTKQKGRIGSMAIKLDMSKAYDHVEWKFLKAIMAKVGFGERWMQLIMECITTVSYSILINEKIGASFQPEHGIRQGDPLSPYLFILCAEGLSALITQAEHKGEIKGVAAARGGMRVGHLFFADDSVLFCRATIEEWQKLQGLLQVYERAFGQCLNQEKTTVFFSSNTSIDKKQEIVNAIGVSADNNYGRDLKSFNKAMLAKQVWRVLNNPNSLVAQLLKQKYFKRGSILNAKKGTNSSLVWQSLWSSIELIKAGSLWRVGSSSSISIWNDKWVKNAVLLQLNLPIFCSSRDPTVSELIDEGECRWKKEVLDLLFHEEEVEKICQIPLSKTGAQDKLMWGYTANGTFTVRSSYYLQQSLVRQMKGECSTPSNSMSDRGDIRWKKPEFKTLKANWDASVSTNLNRASYGIIIRDENGNIMVYVCASHKTVVKPVMAEGLALRRAMEVCANLGLGRVVFEGDAQIIVQAVTSDEEISANYGVLVNDA